jgi:hypothetical protein
MGEQTDHGTGISMTMISHVHEIGKENEKCDGKGSLADCPYSTFTSILYEGKPARFYHGMSVSLPPNTTQRLRYIGSVPKIA